MFAQRLLVILVFVGILYLILRKAVFKKPVIEGFIETFFSTKTYENYLRGKEKRAMTKRDKLRDKVSGREQRSQEAKEEIELTEKVIETTEELVEEEKQLKKTSKDLDKIEKKEGFSE